MRARGVVRHWWPVAALIAASVVAQKLTFESRYDVSGHAAEHLSSATAPFAAVVVIVILFYATPGARRQPIVIGAACAWVAATIAVLVGNVRVVDALSDAGHARTPTSQLNESSTIAASHELANTAPWAAVLAAIVLSVVLVRCGYLTLRAGLASAVVSVVFPPWIIPGAGAFVATILRCIARDREVRVVPPAD